MMVIFAAVLACLSSSGGGTDLAGLVGRCELSRASDPITGRETIKGPGVEVSLAPGLAVALVNGHVQTLSAPVVVSEGRVCLPPDLVATIERMAAPRAAREPAAAVAGLRRLDQPLRIVLDPGHGGTHSGGRARSGLMEKEVVLDVSLRLRDLLQSMGAEVVMTRAADAHFSADVDADLNERVALANGAGADVFLSIHANWHPTPYPRGFEVWIAPEYGSRYGASRALAAEIRSAFRAGLDTEDRGIKEKAYRVVRNTAIPAVLVELEFISNPLGERELGDPAHRQKLAVLLAEAVRRWASRKS